METWILAILALRPKLGSAAKLYTKRAEREALNLTDDVMTVCERMNEINDKKRRIVNMKVLSDRIAAALDDEELALLKEYTDRSAAEIALNLGEGRVKVYRKVKRALAKATRALEKLGFDSERMKEEYSDIELCARTYSKIKRVKNRPAPRETAAVCVPPVPDVQYGENASAI